MTDERKNVPRVVFYSNPMFSGTSNPVRDMFVHKRELNPQPLIIDIEANPWTIFYDRDLAECITAFGRDAINVITTGLGAHLIAFDEMSSVEDLYIQQYGRMMRDSLPNVHPIRAAYFELAAEDLRIHNGKRAYVPAEVFAPWSFKNRRRFKRNQRRQRK